MSTLSRHLANEDILLNLQAASKKCLFEAIGQHMEKTHRVAHESVTAALHRRELAASTALGNGVAVPHARVIGLNKIRVLYVRPVVPMMSYAADGHPVTDIVVLLVPAPATQEHLDVLAHVASLFSEPGFRTALRACLNPADVLRLFERWLH